MLAMFIAVSTVGYMAYERLNSIASSLLYEARPDLKLVILKGILYDLSHAESHIKSYSLTKDDKHLEPYYFTISLIDDKIDALNTLSDSASLETKAQIDSIGLLIEKKFLVWDEMIEVSQNDPLKKVLTQIKGRIEYKRQRAELEERLDALERQKNEVQKIDREPEEMPVITPEKEEVEAAVKKSNIFRRLFGKKVEDPKTMRSADSLQTTTSTAPKEKPLNQQPSDSIPQTPGESAQKNIPKKSSSNSKHDIQHEIALIERRQGNIQQENKARQLEIIEKDKVITNKIHLLIAALEAKEMKRFENRALIVDQQASATNQLIAAFCIAISLLLFAVGYFIVRFVRKTGAHQRALQQAKREAETLVATKEQFMANMSHEIRTPMNSILGFTEQAIKKPSTKTQEKQLNVVKSASEHLMKIINDILDFSKLEAAKLKIEAVPFNPKMVIDETFQMLQVQAEKKGLEFSCSFQGALPNELIGDPLRLKQILVNLLGNAIKFTNEGKVIMEVNPEPKSSDKMALKVKVSDTGIGIPPGQLHSIFEDFVQADTETSRTYGGTGLGLAIAKRLIEHQNGLIEATSRINEGSTFSFSIPYTIGKTNETTLGQNTVQTTAKQVDQLLALIVDDEEYNRLLLTTMLDNWGVAYLEATNGKEAITMLNEHPIDLVLMDVRMPVMDGLKATTYIRNDMQLDVPIVALTAATAEKDIQNCLNAGMNQFISKPFTENTLYQTLTQLIPALKQPKNNKKTPPKTRSTSPAGEFSTKSLTALANGDQAFVTDMLRTFIQTTEEGIDEIQNATEAGNWKKVADYAHKIASPCRHLDAQHLLKLLKTIESNADKQEELKTLPKLTEEAASAAATLIAAIRKQHPEVE